MKPLMSIAGFDPNAASGPRPGPSAGVGPVFRSALFWLAAGTGLASLAGWPAWLLGLLLAPALTLLEIGRRRELARLVADFETATARATDADATPLPRPAIDAAPVDAWNEQAAPALGRLRAARSLLTDAIALPGRFESGLGELVASGDRQEAAVEETASLVANMRQSMRSIADAVDGLLESSDRSASSILQLGHSIEEVANNTGSLHERVDASTSSVHEMGASIRQVAEGAEHVQSMAEETASAVTEMDRSIQEVSNHAVEAANLTDRAREGATAGHQAVRATIDDIEQISFTTSDAMERLDGLVSRIGQIGTILGAIDEINDETNLLSLNAAIIAAQAGEQGKAFLVVANHVKTLARRTAESTQDIEKLIRAIDEESRLAVDAMQTGIDAVAAGVDRSRGAGQALEAIQEACADASERVGEIARATAEQSRNSKGVAEATVRTSSQIQQIGQAIAEQQRASEALLENAETALSNCLEVHRSTDEQRRTSQHITQAIAEMSEQIRGIGAQTRSHANASESTAGAVAELLDNAQAVSASVTPLRELIDAFARACAAATDEEPLQPVSAAADVDERADTASTSA